MRKRVTLFSAALMALTLSAYAGNVSMPISGLKQLQPSKMEKRILKKDVKTAIPSSYNASPLRSVTKAQGVMEAILVDEDFSALTSGTYAKPDTTQMLACQYDGYSPNGIFIDNSLTKDGTWFGNFVYSAGGAIALKTYNPQILSFLCTPIGDYSGDLTVTFRVKANPALVSTEDGGYMKLTGSSVGVQICYGGYNDSEVAKTDDSSDYFEKRIYEKDGWQEVTYTCKNYSANNDGYVCFYTEGSIVIDDVKIKAGDSFLANPVINGITDFQKDNFTISWQPTRKAYNYYVDLYTRNYLSDEDATFVADFNDGVLPEGFESTSSTFTDEGTDDTKALKLVNGDSFTMPTSGNDYKNAHFSLKVIDPTVDPIDPYAEYYVEGYIMIDLKNADGWKNIGQFYAGGYWNKASVVKMEEEYSKFATGGFTQMRLRMSGLSDGAYAVVDDVDITAKPAYEYKIVDAELYEDLNNNYCYTTTTTKTSCTLKNLDPNTEYWYGVRSHYVTQFSDRQFIHALGVAAPDIKEATDIDSRGSFTANWEAAPKATGYTVKCYGVKYAEVADDDYPVFEEDFSKIDASVTTATEPVDPDPLGNDGTTSLDTYTKLPGWTGQSNTVVQGMLGVEGDNYYSGGSITTPEIYLGNSDECKLTIDLYGEANDYIGVKFNGSIYYIVLPDNGHAIGTVTLPVSQPRQSLAFFSRNYAPFVIDRIKVGQSLAKGDCIQAWLATGETDAETLSYTFTNLYDYDFSDFGYNVISHYQYDENSAVSSLTPSEMTFVNLENQTTGVTEIQNASDIKVVARYTADGKMIPAPVKGLNIVKLSNGKVVKVIVK